MYPDATVTASPPWIAVGAPGKDKVYLYAVVPGSSTLLTLLIVPVVFTYLDDFGRWVVRIGRRRSPRHLKPAPETP